MSISYKKIKKKRIEAFAFIVALLENLQMFSASLFEHNPSSVITFRTCINFYYSYFLKKNIPTAKRHLGLSTQSRQEAISHERRLISQLELCDVKWQCSWNVSAYRACLKALDRLCQSNKMLAENLKGKHHICFCFLFFFFFITTFWIFVIHQVHEIMHWKAEINYQTLYSTFKWSNFISSGETFSKCVVFFF